MAFKGKEFKKGPKLDQLRKAFPCFIKERLVFGQNKKVDRPKVAHAYRKWQGKKDFVPADVRNLYIYILKKYPEVKEQGEMFLGVGLQNKPPPPKPDPPQPPPCDLQTLADALLLDVKSLKKIELLLDDKRQVIFQGPPGTGKTYVAQQLAECLAGSDDRVTLVQFHPSYAYEDFVRGFRPALANGQAGFTLQDGPLLRAAQKARADAKAGTKHFLIIDEINRGNLAKVFGELYFLLEYRNEKIRMQYQREDEDDFSLPENLYIIGTMNTADRSIALVDLALRRRFYFIEFHPDREPVKSVLRRWLKRNAPDMDWVAAVADVVDKANKLLDDRHAAIGPSYFMKDDLKKEDVPRIWEHSVLPYIEERLFGEDEAIKQFNLETLAPDIKWDDTEEQKDGAKNNDAGSVNDATDQLT